MEQLPDGSLLVSDDFAGAVYRVSYRQPTTCRQAAAPAGRRLQEEDDGELEMDASPTGERGRKECRDEGWREGGCAGASWRVGMHR